MHKETTALEWVGLVVVGFMVIPLIVNGVVILGSTTFAHVGNGINKVKYNKKIKKGLKDGSIVEVDGQYYEVVVEEA